MPLPIIREIGHMSLPLSVKVKANHTHTRYYVEAFYQDRFIEELEHGAEDKEYAMNAARHMFDKWVSLIDFIKTN